MKISRLGFLGLAAGAMVFGATGLLAFPPPPGRQLPPGMTWCVKCEGRGHNHTWYGGSKKCHICNGTGLMRMAMPPPPPHRPPHVGPGPRPGPGPKPGPGPHVGPGPRPGPGPHPGPGPKPGPGPHHPGPGPR